MTGKKSEPNRLAESTSPYLQQHAFNPVDWYPWGDEALEKAKELDRPIFLSVGYSSCHWCHVMERESFEDRDIAKLMNENFINIKVDREERPDIDALYMNAVQMLSGQGGWPMSVFLTPDLRPFWGGTYFPPRGHYNSAGEVVRPGFVDILISLSRAYRESPEKIENAASQVVEGLCRPETPSGGDLASEEVLKLAGEDAARRFDPAFGGFGPAPKFPRSTEISMLLRVYALGGNPEVLHMCERTLEAMAHGGMYDQVGGGFHRYSTDAKWLVPHFEKMLYDNALLVRTYLEAFQVTGRELYGRIASEVLDYVLAEMTSSEGGFFSATDADSEGREGVFFVWRPAEVEEILGGEDARLFCRYFNITTEGNFEDSTSIAHVTASLDEVAASLGIEPDVASAKIEEGRKKLYEARAKRPAPFRDEKVLTSWNGMMISALARGFQVLGEPRYLQAAQRAAGLILEEMQDGGRLLRVRKDGKSRITGFLDDNAFFIEALLDLYESCFEVNYLEEARRLADAVLAGFSDEEEAGLYFTSEEHELIITRRKDPFDGAVPSPTGVMALNLLRLERLTDTAGYRQRAEGILREVSSMLPRAPMGFGSSLLALDFLLHPPVELALVGDLSDTVSAEFLAVIHSGFLPARVITASENPPSGDLSARVPLLEGKGHAGDGSRLYICRDGSCREPIDHPQEASAHLPFVSSPGG
ncbi:MAG: thioredoxin domain-containing protein [Planctomycetota bacterium]